MCHLLVLCIILTIIISCSCYCCCSVAAGGQPCVAAEADDAGSRHIPAVVPGEMLCVCRREGLGGFGGEGWAVTASVLARSGTKAQQSRVSTSLRLQTQLRHTLSCVPHPTALCLTSPLMQLLLANPTCPPPAPLPLHTHTSYLPRPTCQ